MSKPEKNWRAQVTDDDRANQMGGTFDGGRHPTDVWVWFDDVRALGDYGVPPVAS